jgi:hypothetical protein
MSAEQNTVSDILFKATGNRASGREYLVAAKRAILSPEASVTLKEQWNSAGRDNASIVMRLTEADGSNPHYVTGWDGRETFVCMTESGLTYANYHKLTKMTQDADWDTTTRLIEVRQPLLRETMERTDVDMLLDRIKKTLTKSSKGRRKSRLRNMEKFFTENECKKGPGPESETEFEEVKEKDDRVPKAPEGAGSKSESWDMEDENGFVHRRPLRHSMMHVEDGDAQLDKRELVDVNSETGGGSGGATSGGNKCDPQMKLRQLVRMNKDTGAFSESVRRDTGPGKQSGLGGAPHQNSYPIKSPAYNFADHLNRATTSHTGQKTGQTPYSKPQGKAYDRTGDGRSGNAERRGITRRARRSGNQAARQAGDAEHFQRNPDTQYSLAASTDPQLTLRQQVAMNKEGKGGGGSATPGGNKTDPQLSDREQIDVRNEDKSCGCKGCGASGTSYTDYAGQHGKCPECGARPDIEVRHEGLDLPDALKKKFGKSKSPKKGNEGFMFSLILGKKPGASSMSENTTSRSRLTLVRASGRTPRLGNLAAIRSKARTRS